MAVRFKEQGIRCEWRISSSTLHEAERQIPSFEGVISVIHRLDDVDSRRTETALLALLLGGVLLLSSCSPYSTSPSSTQPTNVRADHPEHEGHEHGPDRTRRSDTASEGVSVPSSTDSDEGQKDTVVRKRVEKGRVLYEKKCSSCHGADRQGGFFYPSLVKVEKRYSRTDVKSIIRNGREGMPAFSELTSDERNAIVSYLFRE